METFEQASIIENVWISKTFDAFLQHIFSHFLLKQCLLCLNENKMCWTWFHSSPSNQADWIKTQTRKRFHQLQVVIMRSYQNCIISLERIFRIRCLPSQMVYLAHVTIYLDHVFRWSCLTIVFNLDHSFYFLWFPPIFSQDLHKIDLINTLSPVNL